MAPREQEQEDLIVHPKKEWMSEEFYARSLHDPLKLMTGDTDYLLKLRSLSLTGYTERAKVTDTKEAIEFASDYSYRSFMLGDNSGAIIGAKEGSKAIAAELSMHPGPVRSIQLAMRRLDLDAVRAFGVYRDHVPSADSKQKLQQAKILETAVAGVIHRGADLLASAQLMHATLADEGDKKHLRGLMFELTYATYRRLGFYESENYDRHLLLGATAFEDNASWFYRPLNHNFDMLVLNADGTAA